MWIGLLEIDSGEIIIDNTNLSKLSMVWLREKISYIPQNVDLLNSSVMDNILISNPSLNEQEISRLLQTVGLDHDLKKSSLTITDPININLSKGILKKIHIARAISKSAQIYIFDDPSLYLDSNGKNILLKFLTSLKRSGKTIICFSNDKDIIEVSDTTIEIGKNHD